MKKNYFLLNSLIVLLWVNSTTNGQPPIKWQKALGGSDYDAAYGMTKTIDNGFITVGETHSPNDGDVTGYNGGFADVWIVKLDANGNLEWQKCLGGSGNDGGSSIIQTTDSGYIFVGYTTSNDSNVNGNHGGFDMWVVKLDANGNLLWQKSLGGTWDDYGMSVVQTTDGGYAVGGTSYSYNGDVSGNHGNGDFWVVKLDASGNIQWQKALGGSDLDQLNALAQTADGSYVAIGGTSSNDGDVSGNHGGADMWVVKLSASGNIQWQKALGGTMSDGGFSIIQTNDGDFIISGSTASNDGNVSGNHGGNSDNWVVKLNVNGNLLWQKALGGSASDQGFSVIQTIDNGYTIAGFSSSNDGDVSGNHGQNDMWIIKLDASGNIQWQKALGGSGSEIAYSIIEVADSNSYVIAGRTTSNDGDVSGNHGNYDFWVVKISDMVSDADNYRLDTDQHGYLRVWPNPTQGLVNLTYNLTTNSTTMKVEVSICDILGREVMRIPVLGTVGENKIEIDISDLVKGVYVIKVAGYNPESLILNP